MKKKISFTIISLLLIASIVFALNIKNKTHYFKQEQIKTELIGFIASVLKQEHYQPAILDNRFSNIVLVALLDDADHDKTIFLQSDINLFKQNIPMITSNLNNKDASDTFMPLFQDVYTKRITHLQKLSDSLFQHPFSFNTKEIVPSDYSTTDFPIDQNAQDEKFTKQIKFYILEQYIDKFEEKYKKNSTANVLQINKEWEKESRQKVQKQMNRYFNKLRIKNNQKDWYNTFYNDIATSMDPHSNYFPPIDNRAFNEELSGRFFGIGARLQEVDAGAKIVSLITGGPAWKNKKITPGDIITKVASSPQDTLADVSGFPISDIVKIIRGLKNTPVLLQLKKIDGSLYNITLIRDKIIVDETYAHSAIIQEKDKKIGYIYLPEFYAPFGNDGSGEKGNHSSNDVAKELEKLKESHVDGVILDLRNNGGGSLYEAIEMVGLFVGKGPVVQVRSRGEEPSVYDANNRDAIYTGPLAVMVNEFSASASEIFAAAIQDYHRGLIVGSSSTFGKGTVQRPLPLGDIDPSNGQAKYGTMKITFQKFYRINGGSTQLKGVASDIVMPDKLEFLKLREKNSPNALSWDFVKKDNYPLFTSFNFNNIIKTTNEHINHSPLFSKIYSKTSWLNTNDNHYSLNIVDFKKEHDEIRDASSIIDSLTTLHGNNTLKISIAPADSIIYYHNIDTTKQLNYQQWLKAISQDLYISEAAFIIHLLAHDFTVANKQNNIH